MVPQATRGSVRVSVPVNVEQKAPVGNRCTGFVPFSGKLCANSARNRPAICADANGML